MADPFEAMYRMMEEPFGSPMRFTDEGPFVPRVDVSEDEEAVHVSCELPGLEVKDIDLTMQQGRLRIRGEKKVEQQRKENGYHYSERRYGVFERMVRLPAEVDDTKVKAAFDHGVLNILLPKSHAERTANKKIEITA